MNWQFWKKQSSISNKSKAYTVPFSLEKFDNSVSSWKEELSYLDTQYRVVLKDTTTKLLSNYNVLFTTFSIRVNSSIKEKIQQIEAEVEQGLIIMKNEILKNLNETLDNLHKECEEEGFESFSEIAEENAQKILNAVYKKFPNYEYYIYPTENQEIAIDCNPYKGRGILILCDSNGSVAYFSTLDGKNSRFRCDNIEDFPYDLLWKTFAKLNKETKYSLNEDFTKKTSLVVTPDKDLLPFKIQNVIYNSTTDTKYQYA